MKKTAVILLNLGTPDAPTPAAVRRYLKEFLSDRRVVEMPAWIWQIILRLFVLPTRPKKVAHAYQSVWGQSGDNDSPMRAILAKQSALVAERLRAKDAAASVYYATTYGAPNIKDVLKQALLEEAERIVVFPLYPQYSATSAGAAFDKVAKTLLRERNLPELIFIKDYHDNPDYIAALAQSVRDFWAERGRADKLLMSFHGIPKPYADKGDPYFAQCHKTAELLAKKLQLPQDAWAISFQSRFGAQEWLKPYTDELLQAWGKQGVKSVQALSPAFSADCLETLEELAVENKANFLQAGGQSYAYIPALNVRADHIDCLSAQILRYL